MEWIVRIEKTPDVENEKEQRIRFIFDPMDECVHAHGECKIKNNKWVVFSETVFGMKISLDELQVKMEIIIRDMRKRLVEYENLDKGFSVLKWIALEDED